MATPMTNEPPARLALVQDRGRGAVWAGRRPSAGLAIEHWSPPPPIQVNKGLLALSQRLLQRAPGARGQSLLGPLYAQVDEPHRRGHGAGGPGIQAQFDQASLGRLGLHLEAGAGRSQEQWNAKVFGTPQGQVSGGVAQAFELLVGGVVLFVDHDHAQAWQRGQNGHARAHENIQLAQGRGEPNDGTLPVREATVQHTHAMARKGVGQACLQLWGKPDLWHQKEHLLVRCRLQAFGHELKVDTCLSGTCHPMQQDGRRAWLLDMRLKGLHHGGLV